MNLWENYKLDILGFIYFYYLNKENGISPFKDCEEFWSDHLEFLIIQKTKEE